MNIPGRILALDYGTKKVGVAITDPLQITASPLTTLRYQSQDDLLNQIREILEAQEVVEIIIGVPVTLSGGESQFTKAVRAFIDWFTGQVDLPVHTLDERFTTKDAKSTLVEMGVRTGHNKDRVDSMAASHLLRFYLDIKEEKS